MRGGRAEHVNGTDTQSDTVTDRRKVLCQIETVTGKGVLATDQSNYQMVKVCESPNVFK